jgi:hypothetical protein
MQGINRLPLSSFLSITSSGKDESDRLSKIKGNSTPLYSTENIDSYDCKWDRAINIPKPSKARISEFINSHWSLCSGGALVKGTNPRDKHDLNWINTQDYLDNWNLLSKDEQKSLRKLILADNITNANRYGLKRKNLESHLLLSLGCDMSNIANTGYCCVESNLKSPTDGDYTDDYWTNRTVDARSSLKAIQKFKRTYSIETLFTSGFVCYQLVITPDSSYKKLTNPEKAKQRYQDFFKTNTETFHYLTKKKKVYSYLYSHEISVDSILGKEYRPHTHVIVWVPKDKDLCRQQESMREIEKWFNRRFHDRTMSFVKKNDLPLRVSKYEDIEKSLGYLLQCYSLSEQYSREAREDNLRSLNLATVEAYHNLIWLYKNEQTKGRVKRNHGGYLPRKDQKEEFKHPLLQKKKKSNTIKKENSKTYVSTRKPSKNKPSDAQRARSAKSLKSGRVQEDCSSAGTGRGILRRNNSGAQKHKGSSCPVSSRTDAEAAKRTVVRRKTGSRHEQAAAESKSSTSRKTTSGRSEKKLRRLSSAKNEWKSGISAISDADAQRSDRKSKSSTGTTAAKRDRRTVCQLNRLQRTVRACPAESPTDSRQAVST